MAFFEELGKKAQAVAGVAAEKAKDLAGVASEKAKSVSDSAKASMEIISEQREMEKNYRAIGEWFVSEYEGEVPDAVKDVVAAVIASKAVSYTHLTLPTSWRPPRPPRRKGSPALAAARSSPLGRRPSRRSAPCAVSPPTASSAPSAAPPWASKFCT
mgnify:CR=1 FL=1